MEDHYAASCAYAVTYGAYYAANLAAEDESVHNDEAVGAAISVCYRTADAAYVADNTSADSSATNAARRRSAIRRSSVLATLATLEGVITIGNN